MTEKLKKVFKILAESPDSKRSPGIRIKMTMAPGNGEQANLKHIHDQLRALGYNGPVEIIYETGFLMNDYLANEEKVANLFNLQLDNNLIVKSPNCNTYFISEDYFTKYHDDFQQFHLGLGSSSPLTNSFLKVDYGAYLGPRPQADSIIYLTEQASSNEIEVSLNETNFRVKFPLPTYKEAEEVALEKSFHENKPSILSILSLHQRKKISIHTIYGLAEGLGLGNYVDKAGLVLQSLIKAHHILHLQTLRTKPLVLLLTNELQRFNETRLLENISKQTYGEPLFVLQCTDRQLENKIQQLPSNAIVLIKTGFLPMTLFEYVYQVSDYAPLSEGLNAKILTRLAQQPNLPNGNFNLEDVDLRENSSVIPVVDDIGQLATMLNDPAKYVRDDSSESENNLINRIAEYLSGVKLPGHRFYEMWKKEFHEYHSGKSDRVSVFLESFYICLTENPLPRLRNSEVENRIRQNLNRHQYGEAKVLLKDTNPFVADNNRITLVSMCIHQFLCSRHDPERTVFNEYLHFLLEIDRLYPEGVTDLLNEDQITLPQFLIPSSYSGISPVYCNLVTALKKLTQFHSENKMSFPPEEIATLSLLAEYLREHSIIVKLHAQGIASISIPVNNYLPLSPKDDLFSMQLEPDFTLDSRTGQPIFYVTVLHGRTEVGKLKLFGVPYFCRALEGGAHNIIEIALSENVQLLFEPDKIDMICPVLPPTQQSRYDSLMMSLQHISISSGSRLFNYILQRLGFSENTAQLTATTSYYGILFALRFYQYYIEYNRTMLDPQVILTKAILNATVETSSIAGTQIMSYFMQQASTSLTVQGKGMKATFMNAGSKLISALRFGIPFFSVQNAGDMLQTGIIMTTGIAMDALVDKIGEQILLPEKDEKFYKHA